MPQTGLRATSSVIQTSDCVVHGSKGLWMTRVLFLKKGGRGRTEVASIQTCSHTTLHCDDLAWDRGNPETSVRIFTWLLTGRGVAWQEIPGTEGHFLATAKTLGPRSYLQ